MDPGVVMSLGIDRLILQPKVDEDTGRDDTEDEDPFGRISFWGLPGRTG